MVEESGVIAGGEEVALVLGAIAEAPVALALVAGAAGGYILYNELKDLFW